MKAILLLHGFMTDQSDFDSLVPKLDGKYDYICRILFPGHGKGENTALFTVNDTFKCLLDTYDELAKVYDEIDVVGFSMGGALATYLQSVRKVHRLVLLSPANKFLNVRLIPARIMFYLKHSTLARKSKKKDIETFNKEMEILSTARENDKRSLGMAINQLLPNYNLRTLNNFVRVVKRCNENLKEITPPTLIIWGNLDQLVPIESVKYDYSLCTNEDKKLVELECMSHLMLNSADVKSIVEETVAFLSK